MHDITDGIDPDAAPRAFAAMLPLLDALTGARCPLNTGLPRAVTFAASVGRKVKQPDMRALFASLPATTFDIVHVDRLESASLATWYAALCKRIAAAQSSSARLPEDFLAAATRHRRHLYRVAEYNLDDVEEVATELESVRPGSGHLDLAGALMRLAVIFEAHADRLSHDTRRYRATDAGDAKRYATKILQVLGDGRRSDAKYWSDYLSRAWTLMVTTYEEVAATGRWLYRHDGGEAMFPSLYAIGRRRRSRKAGRGDADNAQDSPPTSPTVLAPATRTGA
jgi:hypothetical protein